MKPLSGVSRDYLERLRRILREQTCDHYDVANLLAAVQAFDIELQQYLARLDTPTELVNPGDEDE